MNYFCGLLRYGHAATAVTEATATAAALDVKVSNGSLGLGAASSAAAAPAHISQERKLLYSGGCGERDFISLCRATAIKEGIQYNESSGRRKASPRKKNVRGRKLKKRRWEEGSEGLSCFRDCRAGLTDGRTHRGLRCTPISNFQNWFFDWFWR